jgi:hypothetical protein
MFIDPSIFHLQPPTSGGIQPHVGKSTSGFLDTISNIFDPFHLGDRIMRYGNKAFDNMEHIGDKALETGNNLANKGSGLVDKGLNLAGDGLDSADDLLKLLTKYGPMIGIGVVILMVIK